MTQAHTETRMSLCVLQLNKAPKQQARGGQLLMARLHPSAGLLFMWDPNIIVSISTLVLVMDRYWHDEIDTFTYYLLSM